MVIRINKVIGVALVGIVPIYILLYTVFRTRIFKYAFEFKENNSSYFGVFNQLIGNTYFLKINGAFSTAKGLIEKSFQILMRTAIDYAKRIHLFNSLGSTLGSFSQILVILIGGISIIKGKMTIGDFTIASTYFNIFIGSIKYFLEVSKLHQDAKASFERIQELVLLPKTEQGDIQMDEISKISFDKVCFSYGDKEVLNDINFIIEKPGLYRIRGNNGEGKTTLLNLLIGIFQPSHGEIKMNGSELKLLDKNYLWKYSISFQQQNVVLMGQTIQEMLTFGIDEISKDLLNKHICGFKLDSYNIASNTNPNSLSGGERQRLSLVRVLSKNSSIIILDEPTTFLDLQSKLYLEECLKCLMKEKIVILVSHEEMKSIEDKMINIEL